MVLLSFVVVASARVSVAYSNRIGEAVDPVPAKEEGAGGKSAVANIKSKANEERERFENRLDAEQSFLTFCDKNEEDLFAQTVCESGIEDLQNALTRTMPAYFIAAGIVELVVTDLIAPIRGHIVSTTCPWGHEIYRIALSFLPHVPAPLSLLADRARARKFLAKRELYP